ncbi:2-hydroxyacid dehydrogenase [Paracoccaceae bacterium GXU_MW_L88]
MKVFATRKLPDAVEAALTEDFDATLNPDDRKISREEIIEALQNYDGLLPSVSTIIDREMLEQATRCKIIANFGVGYNNIDVVAAHELGISVSNTPDVLTDATADIALLLMLDVTRGGQQAAAMLRRGEWSGFALTDMLGTGLQGKTLGIIGMGAIGQAVARRAAYGFGMDVIYFNRSPVRNLTLPQAKPVGLDTLFETSDVISLHIPGGESTRGFVDAARFKQMKKTAYLVNTARGTVVDETAMIEALQSGEIAGAGLDVFEKEPQVPEALMRLANVSLLPHLGSATVDTRTAMGMLAVDNLRAFKEDRPLPSRVV